MEHFRELDLPVVRGLEHLGDPRVALPFVAASLGVLLFTSSLLLPLFVFLFCLTLLMAGGVPVSTVVRRLSFPLVVAGVLMLTQLFAYGRTPLFHLRLLGLDLVGRSEGLIRGGILVGRVMAGVMLLVFLTSVMPVYRLLEFAGRVGALRLFVLQCLMVYRFASILVNEAARIHEAQAVRLGHITFLRRIRALQLLGTSLVIRSLERSGNVYDGARMRGAGTVPTRRIFEGREGRMEWRTALLLAAAVALFFIAGRVFHVAA